MRPSSSRWAIAERTQLSSIASLRLVDLLGCEVEVLEVERQCADRGVGLGRDNDQTTTRPAPHLGHAVVVDDAHRLPEHRPADAVALDQISLGAEHLAHRPPAGDDLLFDPFCQQLPQLATSRRGSRRLLLGLGHSGQASRQHPSPEDVPNDK